MYKHIAKNKAKSVALLIASIVILVVIGYAVGFYYGYSYEALVLALIIALGLNLISYFSGDKVALWTAGAKPIAKEQNAYVYNIVENLCITAGVPTPKIYIIEDPNINAFATGRKPEVASIALTTGAVQKLENEELEGVVAHELAHIKNYDIRFMMLVVVTVGAIALLSHFFIRGRLFGFGRNRNNNSGRAGSILMIIGIIFIVLSPIIGELIKLAVSRKREFLADASAGLLTRYPQGLASALEKIEQHNTKPMKTASRATAHLYIANPFGGKVKKLFSTHPPVKKRVEALNKMGKNL